MTTKYFLMSSIAALALSAQVHAHGGDGNAIGQAQAAELALHRIERLVAIKRIAPENLDNFVRLEVTNAVAGNADGASFIVTAWQYPGSPEHSGSLKIFMNETGKALRQEENPAHEGAPAPKWPGKDPVTLAENTLHYLESVAEQPAMDPYNDHLVALTVTQDTDTQKAPIANVDITAEGAPKILRIVIKADGSFASAALIP